MILQGAADDPKVRVQEGGPHLGDQPLEGVGLGSEAPGEVAGQT